MIKIKKKIFFIIKTAFALVIFLTLVLFFYAAFFFNPSSFEKKTVKNEIIEEEKLIDEELQASKKTGSDVSPELTTRLRHVILSVDGDTNPSTISNFVQNMLARDSLVLRQKINAISPDIQLKQEIEIGGDVVEVDIPLTTEFFWPASE